MPSDALWEELATLLHSHPAKWMIWEVEPLPDVAKKLAEMGIRSVVFDPCGSAPDEGDFLTVMQQNAAELARSPR